jgi:hypothetical protein
MFKSGLKTAMCAKAILMGAKTEELNYQHLMKCTVKATRKALAVLS